MIAGDTGMDFKVLAVGDVVGNPGMEQIRRGLRRLKRETSAALALSTTLTVPVICTPTIILQSIMRK